LPHPGCDSHSPKRVEAIASGHLQQRSDLRLAERLHFVLNRPRRLRETCHVPRHESPLFGLSERGTEHGPQMSNCRG